ncbi:unnamed protein product [Soboliphyme baturini]|uniref:Uncharacterized protein n=1 Tax=Soboliphyme baturini TaxID=241478 RepID=A0A183J494_9BILA|nr:unnamed protein product [Soboliphyme baturini]
MESRCSQHHRRWWSQSGREQNFNDEEEQVTSKRFTFVAVN